LTGSFEDSPYIPALGLHFTVSFADFQGDVDGKFKEVSGISVELETGMTVNEGGENRFQVRLPGKTKYPNLVLKRGFISAGSALATWMYKSIQGGMDEKIEPKSLTVSLMGGKEKPNPKNKDENITVIEPILSWTFENAYPVKVELSQFNSQATGDSAIVVETLTLAYNYFEVVKPKPTA
jgi:phage tail-like protein